VNGPQDQQQATRRPGISGSQEQQEATRKAVQDQKEAIKRTFSPAPAASPVISCPKGALTQQQAQERFEKFKCREDIPWNYPNDCCYNRAHVMATQLQAEGVDVGKVWNYAPPPHIGSRLRVYTENDPDKYVEWGYHVAPTVPVIDSKGKVIRMVIDPSITEAPLTPEQWKALQGQPRSTLVLTSAAPYFRDSNGAVYPTPTDDEVKEIFDEHRSNREKNWRKAAK
jgi:hypothetical protein